MSSPLSFFGGLDIETIVRSLVAAERGPITRAEQTIEKYDSQLSALSEITSAVSSLGSKVSANLTAAKIGAQTATSSDESYFGASTDGSAQVGQHEIIITQLAKADRHESQRYDDRNTSPIGHGDLQFTINGETTSITVDDTNDTLQGVADAINSADGGGRASIIHDGTGDILILTSKETGTDSDIVFDTNTTDIVFTENQAALDANLKVDGIDIESQSNQVTGAIEGVTLNLLKTDPDQTFFLTIGVDNSGAKDALEEFVSGFNNALSVIDKNAAADRTGGGKGAPFSGDAAIRAVKRDLLSTALGSVSPEDPNSYALLSEIGITLNASGRLNLDSAKLNEVLSEDPQKVTNLFATRGFSDSSELSYVANTSATKSGTFEVDITQIAEQANLTGANVIGGGGLTQDETLTITLQGTEVAVDLLTGDDSSTIVSKINTALNAAGVQGSAEDSGGKIKLSSAAYGSGAELLTRSSVGNIAGSVGFLTTDTSDFGLDIAGTIGGEAATGAGQILSGADDSDMAGLKILATSTSTGLKGDFNFRLGLRDKLNRSVERAVDGVDGRLPPKRDRLQVGIQKRRDRIAVMEAALELKADALRRKFSAAQTAMSQLQAMQASLNGLR